MNTLPRKICGIAIIALFAHPAASAEPTSTKPARKLVKLPGIVIDFEQRCVDLEATICLENGLLELIACTKGSKEHESIVTVAARAMHIHTALLAIGANNGHPAMRKLMGEQEKRWVHIPPSGDLIEVFLVVTNKDGVSIDRPINDFVVRSNQRIDEVDGTVIVATGETTDHKNDNSDRLPSTFLFAGSQLKGKGSGPLQYLADTSGNLISIATFGDELLCLPFHQTRDNDALMWRIKPDSLPKFGTKVTLRLRPQRNQRIGSDE